MIVVPGAGRLPNPVMLVGEGPGREEANATPPQPFVGRSGAEQDWYLSRHDLRVRNWYRTNVNKIYREGNPDPTPADISEWTPVLQAEVAECSPSLVIAVGRYATQWFLGDDATMDLCHGLPHRPSAFDPTRESRAPAGCVILPVTHPASVFHGSDDKKNDIRALIDWDYAQAARVLALIKSNRTREIKYPTDEYPNPHYEDVSGQYLSDQILLPQALDGIQVLAIDTEGVPGNEWSIQVCANAGEAYLLRCSRADFHLGIEAIQRVVNSGTLIATHDASTPAGCCYDTIMCRGMGLDLSRANIFNTMTALYLLRFEPQGLKSAVWRWCGMRMTDYMSLIGDIGRGKQVQYLCRVMDHGARTPWPVIEPRVVHEHDGTSRVYSPHGVEQATKSILVDIANCKLDKDGSPPDPWKRWKQVLPEIRATVSKVLGSMPVGTLEDVPLPDATRYACADADGTLRLYYALSRELERRGLT
jgi:uracil-DNA glycosylase family 4